MEGYIYFFMAIFLLNITFIEAEEIESPLTKTTKLFAKMYDSSCVVLLNTLQNYYDKHRYIFTTAKFLATDLEVGTGISVSTFEQYVYKTYLKRHEIRCNSPMVLIANSDTGTRDAFVKMTYMINTQNINWLLFIYGPIESYLEKAKILFDTTLVVGKIKNDTYAKFFEVYRVAPYKPLRIVPLGEWTPEKGLTVPDEIIYNRRHDLEGMVFTTGSTQNSPIHSFERNAEGRMELVGYFPEVWKELQKILNFTSINLPSVDRVTGIPEANSRNWSGLVGMLQRREIDVAVSEFIMDEQRSHVVDFSRPLLKSTYQIFFQNVGNNFNWNAILRPFDESVWLTVLVWIVVGSIFITACHSYCHQHNVEETTMEADYSIFNSALFITKSLCSQGHPAVPSSNSCRIIYIMAYMVAGVLVPSYSAALISYLTSKTPKRPFDSLEGLLNDGTYKLQTNAKTAEYTYFSNATAPLLQSIYKKLMIHIPLEQLPINTQEALDKVCMDRHLAHFGDMAVAASYMEVVNQAKDCNVITLSQGISTIYSCMGLQRSSPYRGVINHFLQKMEDSGLVGEIKDRTTPHPQRSTTSWSEVETNDVLMIFIILAIGIGLSLFFLAMELIRVKWIARRAHMKTEYHSHPYFPTN